MPSFFGLRVLVLTDWVGIVLTVGCTRFPSKRFRGPNRGLTEGDSSLHDGEMFTGASPDITI